VAALKHAREIGLRSVFLNQKDGGVPLHHPDAEPFWTLAEDYAMPISVHIHTNPFVRGMNPEYQKIPGTKELMPVTVTMAMAEHLSNLMFGGVFMRHPKLKVVLAEGGIGWIPAILERMDHVFKVHRPYMGSPIKELPSETYQKNCFATFGEDRAGLRLRDMMGVHTIMWASDYPHTDTTFPESKQTIDRMFEGISVSDKHKIVSENAARLYGFK
jgi:predicted TIM-barrel fold metal-dependent hydrolase